jgi:hypothetical protein
MWLISVTFFVVFALSARSVIWSAVVLGVVMGDVMAGLPSSCCFVSPAHPSAGLAWPVQDSGARASH